MTSKETWLSRILGSGQESQSDPSRVRRSDPDSVRVREITPRHHMPQPDAPVPQPPRNGEAYVYHRRAPQAPQHNQAPQQHTQQPQAPVQQTRTAPQRPQTPAPLNLRDPNGKVKFVRTSDAEIARRRAEDERTRLEAIAREIVAAETAAAAAAEAAAQAAAQEQARTHRPENTWVQFTRTPQTILAARQALRNGETLPPDDELYDEPHAEAPFDDDDFDADHEAFEEAPPASPVFKRDRRPTNVEVQMPRNATKARTVVQMGVAPARIRIEEPEVAPAPRREEAKPSRVVQVKARETQPEAPAPIPFTPRSARAPAPVSETAAQRPRMVAQQPVATETLRRPAKKVVHEFEFPSTDMLGHGGGEKLTMTDPDILEDNARLLEGVLDDFGVKGEIINVRPGPVVTLYEFEPAPGVKSSRVIGLADDIARSMAAVSARVAVVQGRNVIGIELPNFGRETVYFRDMVESHDFEESKHKLAIALGKTIGGEPVIVDLARMPHLLVAGTTGSGKSVAINTMILSLLFRLKPEQCRLIMVDPKMLELSIYDGIPHLLTPVVTDPKKAVVALKWAVREMEDRYKKMSKVSVRNIDGYNARVAEAKATGKTITRTVQTGFDRNTGEAIYEQETMDLSPLPYIVIIVDEMADLMMVAGKDIEGAIQRLAQMARAAGIHLIMATQRPSVDVITGTIKANFPTRISFQVTSKIDSRTILGEQGAEQLLGQGDMLHMVGGGRIARVHGPFVSDEDVETIVAHLKTQGVPEYLDSITAEDEETEASDWTDGAGDTDGEGDLYDRAVAIVLRDKKCSTSYIQRRLSVGYNKAASLVERMEKEGLVSPANHAGKREILVGGGIDRGAFDA